MKRVAILALACAGALALSGCITSAVVGTAGAVVGTTAKVAVKTTGAVVGTAVDVVTPGDGKSDKKDKKKK
jgi:hypothetical protein